MNKTKIRKGDLVRVISGAHKGKEGKVLKFVDISNKVIVEGVNIVKKHTKPNSQDPKGGIKEKEAAIHISNISLFLPDGKVTRVGYKFEGNEKIRYSKKTNEVI
ncbi:MAG: 50S ribosomal protein L24 [Flavobacteriaceae bacterium]|nr:50S ribosomal protein L24 [Flavobacteriaceae bacterium]|tara:strand:- start:5100 stop:5411 length:312 start_codon:yes stop_codon:yes gene_type:complete